MSELNKQRRTPLNCPDDGDAFSMMLEAMSVDELTDALNDALENITEENYDPALIDAYLAALDCKDPMPKAPDAEASYAGFQKKIQRNFPERRDKKAASRGKFRRVWRIGLAAVLTIICILGGMIVAQAAGLDVFGAMAHWTDNIFSFGKIRSKGGTDDPNDTAFTFNGSNSEAEFTSLQEALDVYGITEVSEPAWLPEGYTFKSVVADCWPNGEFICLAAEYSDGTKYLVFEIERYKDKPSMQVEKTNAPVETFAVNNSVAYLVENINNNAAAWMTEHYACFIGGQIEKSKLRKMVLSVYEKSDSEAEFTSLQEALDMYGITEVSEPAWIPEGYTLDSIETLCMPDGTLWHLSAAYTNGIAPLHIVVDSYWDKPMSQIEKTDAPVENFAVNDTIVYLLENINDNSAAWVTEHYECFISGAVEKSELRQMVLSAYADIQ